MMGTADKVLDLMYRWMEKREHCAEQLRELARELEVLREKCNRSECVRNSVQVAGAASLVGAGLLTFFTGGLAAPLLAAAGAVYAGAGLTISLVTQLTKHLSSSETMKKAQSIASESNEIAEEIKRLFEQLKVECKAESVNADEDELDKRVMAKTLSAIARRDGQNWTVFDSIKWSSSSGPQSSLNALLSNGVLPVIAAGVAGILVVFAFKASGKKAKPLFAEAGKQIIQNISTTGPAVKGCGKVAGGAVAVVGLAFALDEAIGSWMEMIKNNHVTEASQSLRDTANALYQMCRTLRNQFRDTKRVMAQKQREYEEMEKERLERLEKERLEEERKEKERLEWLEWLEMLVKKWQKWLEMLERLEEEGKEKKETPFVRAALLNVHSMNKKTSKILKLITENQLHVFFSTETWLKFITADRVLREASPPNFRFFRHVSEVKGYRGVAIQFSKVLHGEQIHFNNNMEIFECVVTVLKHKEWEEPVLSINLYRPPKKTLRTIKNFLDELKELLVSQNYKNIIVTGDFNIWVDCGWITYVKEFYRFLSGNGFNLYPWEPTYRSGHTLDLVLTKNVEISDVKVQDNQISDHYTVYFNLRPVQRR